MSKLYFCFTERTAAEAAPCHSSSCWSKSVGQPLQFCGKDICAYDAASTCKQELEAARPDGRKRRRADVDDGDGAGGDVGEGDVDDGALVAWRLKWGGLPA